MKDLSIVIPSYNEEGNILELYRRLDAMLRDLKYDAEIIFVNDGSHDNTLNIAKDLSQRDSRVRVIDFSRNFGHQIAITAGLDYATGQACVVMDADLQHSPEVIPQLIEKWRQGFEVVYALRLQREGETFFKKLTAGLFYKLMKKMADHYDPVNVGDFRLMDRKVVDAFCSLRERHRFVRGLVSWLGFRQTSIYYQSEPRFSGETKYSFWKMVKFAADGITSLSYRPLQAATLLGSIFSLTGFIYALWAIFNKIFGGWAIRGWTSLIVMILFLGGVQLLTLGVIGEYIGRIFEDVKQRPLYIIRDEIGFAEKSINASSRRK